MKINKKYLLATIFLTTIALVNRAGVWDSFKKKASSAVTSVKNKTSQYYNSARDALSSAKNRVVPEPIKKKVQDVQKIVQENWRETKEFLHLERKKTPFCNDLPPTLEPSIYESASDEDPLNIYLKQYAPIIYLHSEERALPISAQEYFEHKGTSIVYQQNHGSRNASEKEILIPAGHVTSRGIYDLSVERGNKPDDNIFAEIDECITAGANPNKNQDASGNLTTPAYVKAKQVNNKLYLTYVFFYGFNYPYQVKLPVFRIPLPPGEILNAHECDIEHIVEELELVDGVWVLSRIFFAAHGNAEGIWLDVLHPDKNPENFQVQFEGTHPVVFSAKGGHGSYPEVGTYVRIFGFANDLTNKGIRWTPQWSRVYEPSEPEFNPDIHGWVMLPGDCGPRGVGSLGYKAWFSDPTAELKCGNVKNIHFCAPSKIPGKEGVCVRAKTFVAKIPK